MKHPLKILCFIGILLFNIPSIAQQKLPYSFTHKLKKKVPTLVLEVEKKEIQKVLALDEKRRKNRHKNIPIIHRSYQFTKDDIGKWETLASGDRVWRLKVHSKGATGLGFLFTQVTIPDGAAFFFYNKAKTSVLGPITKTQHLYGKHPNTLSVNGLMGNEVLIEYYEPKDKINQGNFILSKVSHRFQEFPYTFTHDLTQEVKTEISPILLDAIKLKNKQEVSGYWQVYPNWNPSNSGTWSKLPNGDKLWRLRIDVTGFDELKMNTKHTFIYLNPFQLSKGVNLFIYSEDKTFVSEKLDSPFQSYVGREIPHKVIILELYVPKGSEKYYKLNLSTFGHEFFSP